MSVAGDASLGLSPAAGGSALESPVAASASAPLHAETETRLVALDGMRGLMTILVLVSHYFGEVPNGFRAVCVGWIAVHAFFALSGFLVGRLILDKADRANFFTVFYVRRACRTVPVYVFCVLLVFGCIWLFADRPWGDVTDGGESFPLWSYLTFWQNFLMISQNGVGNHWLGPTWTLTVEEHFYLIAPAMLLLTPRRHLLKVLIAGALFSVAFRAYLMYGTDLNIMWALVTLPSCADALFCGIIAAVIHRDDLIRWRHYDQALRIGPIVLLLAAILVRLVDSDDGQLFTVVGFFLVSVAGAVYILSIVRGAPESLSLHSRTLRFFGNNSYSIYLTHVGLLGLMHGLILGTTPDIATLPQVAVTLATIPLAVLVGWALTKLVEEPITAYGRSWKWSERRRGRPVPEQSVPFSLAAR